MHEFSIAQSILKTLDGVCVKEGLVPEKVSSVCLVIGAFTSIHVDSLNFAMEVLTKDSGFSKMKIEVEEVPLKISCRTCGAETALEEVFLICGSCGAQAVDIVRGKEFYIKSIESDKPDNTDQSNMSETSWSSDGG